ncbi:hypothetical protein Sjap_023581 [Stephania japonica]|uniref:Uncharacterized protein n=1 Tax=Stephania japonica TaxID=461633 RepID=A0AAP0HKL7_9MAGN
MPSEIVSIHIWISLAYILYHPSLAHQSLVELPYTPPPLARRLRTRSSHQASREANPD